MHSTASRTISPTSTVPPSTAPSSTATATAPSSPTYSFFTDDLFFKADLDKISDRYLLQDFYEGEFTKNPNPDNVVSLAFTNPTFITTLSAVRFQANNFFDSTERLPDLSLDMPRTPLGNSGDLLAERKQRRCTCNRTFDDATILPEYSAYRFDTFHQFTDPQTLFGWLNLVNPRVGLRATYYSASAPANTVRLRPPVLQRHGGRHATFSGVSLKADVSTRDGHPRTDQAARQSDLLNEQSVKCISRPAAASSGPCSTSAWRPPSSSRTCTTTSRSRALGLDKIQHIIQPYVDVSFIEDFGQGSRKLLQFDRLLPTTQLSPIDFPQFNSIDTIDETSAVRMGVRNRLQTKRDALTFDWLELDTFFQVERLPARPRPRPSRTRIPRCPICSTR